MKEIKSRKDIIESFIEFFKSKSHKEIPNASLIPENDPTVLFTTAGMHPLVPFLLGQKHPQGKRLVNIQKCIRTGDIEEVGDSTHHTFFEMLGNWSLGDYFKKEAIEMSFEFLTEILNLEKEKLAISVFGGDERVKQIPVDNESAKIWESLGIPKERITFIEGGVLESDNNWWGPAGNTGPCGPDTEMFYWSGKEKVPEKFDPEDERWVEIWNDVLMQYNKDEKGIYNEAKQKNIDTGMGLERTLAVLNDLDDNYLTEVWLPIIIKIEKVSGEDYKNNKKSMRIIADHIKASVFIIADGIKPSNTEQGYVLRRLIRRAIRYSRELGIEKNIQEIAKPVFEIYKDYNHLQKNKGKIIKIIGEEQNKFLKTLDKGMKEFYKIIKNNNKKISGEDSFLLYQSYGFPIEITKELAKENNLEVDEDGFQKEFEKHQKLSRTASEGKFKSGLADNTEKTKKLHTATHLLNRALKEVLNNENIHQKGSNINPERLRFDFNFDRKLTDQEKEKVENWINKKIKEGLPIRVEEMSLEDAKKQNAEGIFENKYGEKVKVYSIGEKEKEITKEICAGPHVKNTKEIGHFKIKKEESSSAGVRRIKAILE